LYSEWGLGILFIRGSTAKIPTKRRKGVRTVTCVWGYWGVVFMRGEDRNGGGGRVV